MDEPTTGLHFSDVQRLMSIVSSLVERGNTLLVIEHHLDVIANAHYLIDLGPEGGDGGGQLLYQ
jgi:excinuclease ABC subunit A